MTNPRLRSELARAFDAFALMWPRSAMATKTGPALDLWAEALNGVPLAAIEPATRRWIAEEKYAPTPAEFGKVVRKIAAELDAAHRLSFGEPEEHPHAGLICKGCGCRVRYWVHNGVDRLLFECEARARGLALAANQSGLPEGW